MTVQAHKIVTTVDGERKGLDSEKAQILMKSISLTSNGVDQGMEIQSTGTEISFSDKAVANVVIAGSLLTDETVARKKMLKVEDRIASGALAVNDFVTVTSAEATRFIADSAIVAGPYQLLTFGIVTVAANNGGTATVLLAPGEVVTGFTGLTVGQPVFASKTVRRARLR